MNPTHPLPPGGFPRPAGGFTMVELLVVVAILLALAALIFGVTRKAFFAAEMANKTSMYRQHFAAAGLYSADHHGRVCPARDIKSAKSFKVAEITEHSRRIFSGDSRSWYISPWRVDTTRHHNGTKGMFVMFDGAVTFLDAAGAKRAINNPGRPSNN